jgi:oligopeptidase B
MSTQPAAPEPERTPPAARRIPRERTFHGDTFIDEYAWLGDKEDRETIAYLEAENAYTEAMTAGQAGLRDAIFDEIKARTQETDLSVPNRKGGWWYYTRTVEGMQYPVYCRRAVRPDDAGPPISEDGSPLDGEQVLLDGNQLAGDEKFFSMGAYDISPDGRLLAYSTDFSGSERFTMRVKDVVTGETAADEIPDTFYGSAWSRDGSALFYVTVDEAWRPYRVWRHMVGTPAAEDVIVYEEPDEKFWVGVGLTRSERYLLISADSKLTSEAWLLDAAQPQGEFTVVMPRRPGVEYSVEHQVRADGTDRLLILHNDHAENFELAEAPVRNPAQWTPVIPGREDTRLLGVDAFAEYLVVYLRRDGLTGLRIVRPGGAEHEVAFGEPVYTVAPGSNPDYESGLFRLGYASLVSPDSVYDCDMATGQLTLLKRRPVLPLPDGSDYDPGDYEQYREWALPAMAALRSCSPATAVTRSRWTRASPFSGCRCWTAASATRSRTSAAAARWAAAGTTTARCCARPTPSPTSSRAPSTSWPGAGRRRHA